MSGMIGIFLTVSLLTLLPGCNKISLNGTSTPNETAPNAPILASGQLIGLNGKTVGGLAIAYNPSSGANILRLSGITLPNETGMQIIANVNGVEQSPITVQYYTGSTNYTMNVSGSTAWTIVTIHSTATNLDYAQAIMK